MNFQYAIALTGSIATGKSSVVACLRRKGFEVIDADQIAHEILEREYRNIALLFGTSVISEDKVDRKKLGEIVFADRLKRTKLEAFLHPLIYDEIVRLSAKEESKKAPYFIDIPLFFESHRYAIAKSLVVYTPPDKQLKRLMQRNHYTQEEAQLRINAQIAIEEKRTRATYLIDNSATLLELEEACEKSLKEIQKDFL